MTIKIYAKKVHNFADSVVEKLGKLVGEVKKDGVEQGLSEEEIKKIWLTIFEIMVEKMKPKSSN